MNRACTKCHGMERVQGARKPAEDWRVTLVDMRERGAQLVGPGTGATGGVAGKSLGNQPGQMNTHRAVIASVFGAAVLAVALLGGETPASTDGVMNLTATTANVGGAPDAVRIEILRWSTDEERDRLMAAWSLKLPALATGGGGAGRGRGNAAARGGKGPGRGAPAAEQAPLTPEGALARALQATTTVGYLWSSEIAGYALRFAGKETKPDGSQRIVLITDRRLGAMNERWNSHL